MNRARDRDRWDSRRLPGARDFVRTRCPIASACPHVDACPLDAHLQLAVPAIKLAVGRVVPEQVIGREVVRDLSKILVEIVAVHDSDAIGCGGERPHGVLVRPQRASVLRRRETQVDRRVECDEAPRIDRIEARVAAVGIVDDVAEEHLVVHGRQPLSVGVALHLARGQVAVSIVLCRELAVRPDTDRIQTGNRIFQARHGILAKLLEAGIGPEQLPAFGHRQDGFPFLANAVQVSDEILESFERDSFSLPPNELLGERRLGGFLARHRRITNDVGVLPFVSRRAEALSPDPMLSQLLFCHRPPS